MAVEVIMEIYNMVYAIWIIRGRRELIDYAA